MEEWTVKSFAKTQAMTHNHHKWSRLVNSMSMWCPQDSSQSYGIKPSKLVATLLLRMPAMVVLNLQKRCGQIMFYNKQEILITLFKCDYYHSNFNHIGVEIMVQFWIFFFHINHVILHLSTAKTFCDYWLQLHSSRRQGSNHVCLMYIPGN